jgi:sugar (pentulose or hexulose) kinase
LTGSNTIPVTAVFDIGKTNKKFFLFGEDFSVIRKQQTSLEQTKDEDGDSCEDLEVLTHWVENKIAETLQDNTIRIRRLNFTTYGASLVHLNKAGEAVTPLYSYLKPYPEELFEQFCNTYGGKKKLSLQTASPPMGMLNSGFQLYWLKHTKPLVFQEIQHSLHLPQYLSYLITGKASAELTSIGCHTALWDYESEEYHAWTRKEEVRPLLPSVSPVSTVWEASLQENEFKAGIGIHDSSSALAPYLIALDDPFMLVSTGTWSITFNPFNKESLTYQELERDALCYLNIYGEQVKASRFFLGNEYMHQRKKLNNYFNEDWQHDVPLSVDLIQKRIEEGNPQQKLKLEKAYNTGPYPTDEPEEWEVETFDSFQEAYHQLMLDLVAIQAESIRLAQGAREVEKILVTGGFSQNDFYMSLLASFFPNKTIYTASLPNASALGAALVVNDMTNMEADKHNIKSKLGMKRYKARKDLNLQDYSWTKSVAG